MSQSAAPQAHHERDSRPQAATGSNSSMQEEMSGKEALTLAGENLLLCFSRLGLGLAGFSGLIGTFRLETKPLTPRVLGGLGLLLEHALALIVLSLLPLLIFYFVKSPTKTWQLSSLGLAAFLVMEGTRQLWRVFALLTIGQGPGYPNAFIFLFLLPTAVFASLVVINIRKGRFPTYVLGLFWMLSAGLIQFWLLI